MTTNQKTVSSFTRTTWDAVIIGTGFGGSMTALQLARAGLRVLLLERGDWVVRDDSAWSTRAILVDRKYKAHTPYEADKWLGRGKIYPDIAIGGNSVFYGGASLRLREQDFYARTFYGDDLTSDLAHVDWPLRYTDLAVYYDAAEKLLGVAGEAGADPHEPPRTQPYPQAAAPYSSPAQRIAETGKRLGLHPFPLPLAINYGYDNERARCIHCTTCDLFPCKIAAKNDLAVTVLPEVLRHGGEIRPNTVVTKIIHQGGHVSGVACLDSKTGESFTIRCGLCVVSGGAIGSAKLLLLSGLGEMPVHGRLIGRYLMRHCNGIVIGLFPFATNPEQKFNKQVGFTDFYHGGPQGSAPKGPWGMLQALQVPPPEYIKSEAPFPIGNLGAASTKYHMYLLCIAEDLPNPENRVSLHASAKDGFGLPIARIDSRYHRRDQAARRALYREGARILREAGALIRVKKPISTYSHAIGTCRFGDSPEVAVLDRHCRFFGMRNLFVVDGSFMPTSGSVNPSLTIAANALRVGEHLVSHWQQITGSRRGSSVTPAGKE